MASIRKRGSNSYLIVVSRGYDYAVSYTHLTLPTIA